MGVVDEAGTLSSSLSIIACVAMALLYVAILYAPTVILRLPTPPSFEIFLLRRFVCASISTVVSLFFAALILPIDSWDTSNLLGVYGIRTDHLRQAVVYPLLLTSLMYAGSFVLKIKLLLNSWRGESDSGVGLSFDCIRSFIKMIPSQILSAASDISAWRNLVVAPLTEELVFRACMIPLLLCGRFRIYSAIFLCPILFSLAHLNHFMEIYIRNNNNFLKATVIVGFQLGYTVLFGSYASFLFIRTGHIVAPLLAHVFCNYMGLPLIISRGKVSLAFVAGLVAFVLLVFPVTQPRLYNNRTDDCRCWQGYCSWE